MIGDEVKACCSTDTELKVAIGRLVDRSSDGEQLKANFDIQITSIEDPRWLILTRYLCMERIQRPDIPKTQRASYKVAHYLSIIDQGLVKTAFTQLLEYCCEHFGGQFDALFQWVAAVVDIGRKLSQESLKDADLISTDYFFKILRVQEKTADNKTFRLAFRFVQFLTKLASVDGETFQVNDSINDDVVSRLFEDETNHDGDANLDEDKAFDLPAEELADLSKRRAPKTVKTFMEAFRSKEDPITVLVALSCFQDFSIQNQSAIRAQSRELIDLLIQLENSFNIADFVPKVNNCIVHVLALDLTVVPSFCQRIIEVYSPLRRMQIVNCVGALVEHLLNAFPQTVPNRVSKGSQKQTREIGRVIRKSVALTNKSAENSSPKAVIDVVDKVLRPFMSTILAMDVVKKTEPITIAAILTLLKRLQERVHDFCRLEDEYARFLEQISDSPCKTH